MRSEQEPQETQRVRSHLWHQEKQEETEEAVRDHYGYPKMLRRERSDSHYLSPVARSKKTVAIQEDMMENLASQTFSVLLMVVYPLSLYKLSSLYNIEVSENKLNPMFVTQ